MAQLSPDQADALTRMEVLGGALAVGLVLLGLRGWARSIRRRAGGRRRPRP